MKSLTKNYQLWHSSDNGYHLSEFDTLEEAIDHIPECYTNDFYITKKVVIEIKERELK